MAAVMGSSGRWSNSWMRTKLASLDRSPSSGPEPSTGPSPKSTHRTARRRVQAGRPVGSLSRRVSCDLILLKVWRALPHLHHRNVRPELTRMPSKGQITGMRGVYLVAAELSRLGFIVSPTSRSAAGADLLVTNHSCSRAFSVQVKTNARTFRYWLVGENALNLKARSHIYVLVNLKQKPGKDEEEFFVVLSATLAKLTREHKRTRSTWYSVARASILGYRDRWKVFGSPA